MSPANRDRPALRIRTKNALLAAIVLLVWLTSYAQSSLKTNSPDANLNDILSYIHSGWDSLTRSTSSCDSVADPKALMDDQSAEWKIPELFDRLQLEKFNFEKQDMPEATKNKLRGLIVLQADKSVDSKVLNRVMKTAYAAEYTDVMFAITKKRK